jgi:hydroxymethylpyrimidine pyrophosphatase-like HAD family hydrolase
VAGGDVECTTSGGGGLVEVSAAGVSKVDALAAFCATRGIGATEVLAFGDMPNDLGMLTWAGRGYAMTNAHPTVLAAVALRAGHQDEDGVARVLEAIRF